MEVGELQSERRQRLATLRKRNKETRVPQWRVNSITCKGRINLNTVITGMRCGQRRRRGISLTLALDLTIP